MFHQGKDDLNMFVNISACLQIPTISLNCIASTQLWNKTEFCKISQIIMTITFLNRKMKAKFNLLLRKMFVRLTHVSAVEGWFSELVLISNPGNRVPLTPCLLSDHTFLGHKHGDG